MSDLLERIDRYLRQLAPHMRGREGVLILFESRARIKEAQLEDKDFSCSTVNVSILKAKDAKIAELTAQLAELEKQEPVAWRREWDGDESDLGCFVYVETGEELDNFGVWEPLYTHPVPNDLKLYGYIEPANVPLPARAAHIYIVDEEGFDGCTVALYARPVPAITPPESDPGRPV